MKLKIKIIFFQTKIIKEQTITMIRPSAAAQHKDAILGEIEQVFSFLEKIN